ncbi:unnamed protein product [Didymodactylos carnosus]|uniref:Uncharacterized protein n=1 Tax=Didymodactylos carnosus TaxID=1234261 RepID=A0A8S2JC40_9BILA|nr:unnamed protein product [Didymodactylos carnosus]CAF3804294.1 unnamed protein product [Didymodactylos carnosus]
MQAGDTTSKQEMLDYFHSNYQSDDIRLKQINNFNQKYINHQMLFDFVRKQQHSEQKISKHCMYNLRYFIIDLCKTSEISL